MSSLQPAQLTESPVAESIQEGRMAICQHWEQRIPIRVEGRGRPLPLLAPGLEPSSVLFSVWEFKILSVISKLARFCAPIVLTWGHLGLSTFRLCVLRF